MKKVKSIGTEGSYTPVLVANDVSWDKLATCIVVGRTTDGGIAIAHSNVSPEEMNWLIFNMQMYQLHTTEFDLGAQDEDDTTN